MEKMKAITKYNFYQRYRKAILSVPLTVPSRCAEKSIEIVRLGGTGGLHTNDALLPVPLPVMVKLFVGGGGVGVITLCCEQGTLLSG
jgi:hypothetical protein